MAGLSVLSYRCCSPKLHFRLSKKLVDGKIEAEWTPFAKEGQVELFLAPSNTFKEKGVAQADSYTSLGKVDLAKGKASIALPAVLAGKKFYKLVLSAEHNAVNRWIIP